MKLRLVRGAFLMLLTAASPAAFQQESTWPLPPVQQEDPKLPNGKSQHDEILKAEREQNIRDAARLVEMAGSLKADLEKNDRFILSMDTLKKTDDIEKLVKKIRDRLHH
jgi:hypothetical protein